MGFFIIHRYLAGSLHPPTPLLEPPFQQEVEVPPPFQDCVINYSTGKAVNIQKDVTSSLTAGTSLPTSPVGLAGTVCWTRLHYSLVISVTFKPADASVPRDLRIRSFEAFLHYDGHLLMCDGSLTALQWENKTIRALRKAHRYKEQTPQAPLDKRPSGLLKAAFTSPLSFPAVVRPAAAEGISECSVKLWGNILWTDETKLNSGKFESSYISTTLTEDFIKRTSQQQQLWWWSDSL